MKNGGASNQQQQQQQPPFVHNPNNFPIIDDEYNLVGSRRKPSADVASPPVPHKSPDLLNRHSKASSKAYKQSRGTVKNDNTAPAG